MARPAARGGRSGRGAFGFIATLERKVGLTPEQRDAVRGLLAEQRQKSQAMREETDGKIRALLNPEQQKKFDDGARRAESALRAKPTERVVNRHPGGLQAGTIFPSEDGCVRVDDRGG